MIISLLSKIVAALRSSSFIHRHLWGTGTPSRFLELLLLVPGQCDQRMCDFVSERVENGRWQCKGFYKTICVRAWRKEVVREREGWGGGERWRPFVFTQLGAIRTCKPSTPFPRHTHTHTHTHTHQRRASHKSMEDCIRAGWRHVWEPTSATDAVKREAWGVASSEQTPSSVSTHRRRDASQRPDPKAALLSQAVVHHANWRNNNLRSGICAHQ